MQNLSLKVGSPVLFVHHVYRMMPITVGRIWWLRIYYWKPSAKWCISIGLSQPSLPARPEIVFLIEPQRGKPGCAIQSRVKRLRQQKGFTLLAPKGWVYFPQSKPGSLAVNLSVHDDLKDTPPPSPKRLAMACHVTWASGL